MSRWLFRRRIFIVKKYKSVSSRVSSFINRKPLTSFFVILGLVLLLIIIGNILPKPKPVVTKMEVVKKVDVYRIGKAPKVTVQAQIRKSGVIQINAQTSGIVSFINVTEGTKVSKGTSLLNISSNYYGGNAASIQRQIAQKQDENMKQTYDAQKDLIQKQKDLAGKADENSDQLRDITAKSKDETQGLIDLNQQIIDALDITINDPNTTSSNLAAARQTKSQYLAALNQARAALRSADYQSANDKPPAQISDMTRDIAIKQLELQEKQLALNKEVTHLQYLLALVTEGIYYPVAPFSGIVERVFVKPFENVNPGTPLLILSQVVEDDPVTAVAFVSKEIAQSASQLEPSILHIGDNIFEISPSFISTEAVQGSLYAIYYPIPEELSKKLTNEGFITVEVPIGYPDTSSVVPFIPIDAIYQTRTSAYLFVVDKDRAKSKEVSLGLVYGRYVEITNGIGSSDQVILNRNVIDGDKVEAN